MALKKLVLSFILTSIFAPFSFAESFDSIREVTLGDVSCTQSSSGFKGSVTVRGDLALEVSFAAVVENNSVELTVNKAELCDALISLEKGSKVELILNQQYNDLSGFTYSLQGLIQYPRVILNF